MGEALSNASATESGDLDPARVVEQYRPRLYRYILGMVHDRHTAEDLTQETFLRALPALDSLRDPAALPTWLYRLATNACVDRFRADGRRKTEPLDPLDEQPALDAREQPAPRIDRALEQVEMSACVHRYVDELSDDYRAAILLHDFHEFSSREIAEILGCSVATAKIRIHRARAKLGAALEHACEFEQDDRGVTVCAPATTHQEACGDGRGPH